MLDTVLGYLTNTVVVGALAFVAGVVFSQKVKDFLTRTPSEFRASMRGVEQQAKADFQVALQDVFSKYLPSVSKSFEPLVPLDPVQNVPAPPTPAPPAPVPTPEAPQA